MDNFKAVYKILSQLEKEMDNEYADIGKFDLNDPPKMVHRSIDGYIKRRSLTVLLTKLFNYCSVLNKTTSEHIFSPTFKHKKSKVHGFVPLLLIHHII